MGVFSEKKNNFTLGPW